MVDKDSLRIIYTIPLRKRKDKEEEEDTDRKDSFIGIML